MSVTVTAALVYGFEIGCEDDEDLPGWWNEVSEDDRESYGFDELADDRLIVAAGFQLNQALELSTDSESDEWNRYYAAKHAARKQLKVTVEGFGFPEQWVYYLTAKVVRAYAGRSKVVLLDDWVVDSTVNDDLAWAAKVLDVEVDGHPQVMLVADYSC